VVLLDRKKDHGHKLKHRRFPLNIRKHTFTVRMAENWHRLSTKVVGSPSPDILRNYLDMVLDSLL